MLIDKQNFSECIPGAKVIRLHRTEQAEPHNREIPSRFHTVLDDNGYEAGAVTRHYQLVRNNDLIGAIDLASDNLGVDLQAGTGRYYNGKAQYNFYLPDSFKVPGDASDIRPQITLGNSYGGKAALTGTAGVFRLICSNGLTIGTVVRADYQRHIGEFDLMVFVTDLMQAVINRAQEYQTTALIAAETEFSIKVDAALNEADKADRTRNRAFVVDLAETTPKKYREPLRRSILSNRESLGETVWAMVQAISEVSTHDMQGWSAGNWQHKQTDKLFELVGINA